MYKGNHHTLNHKSARENELIIVTLTGSFVNLLLIIIKFIAGIVGHSSAMIADAIHSCSDFVTDVIVIVFLKISGKPEDEDHDFGHGKFETLATLVIGVVLFIIGIIIAYSGIEKIVFVAKGGILPSPQIIAFVIALISILLKEIIYQFTIRAGKRKNSPSVIANAWHHRSDALSSICTSIGIGCAIFWGEKWTILDPITAVIVSLFIFKIAYSLAKQSADELLEKSLNKEMEQQIVDIATNEEGVSEVHNLRTRRIGNRIAIEMHLRMDGSTMLYYVHNHATNIENEIRKRFGPMVHIIIHTEPTKHNGKYIKPTET